MGTRKELDDLIDAFGRHLQQEHANPERVECPGNAALKAFATKPGSIDATSILDHIRHCAPCLNELRSLKTTDAERTASSEADRDG